MNSKTFLVLTLILTAIACNPPSEINNRHDEVMAIHDEVMPKMKDIYRLTKELKKLPPSDTIEGLLVDLDNADEAMMEWMRAYKKPNAQSEEAFIYLEKQKSLVNDVKSKMLISIENAQIYLDDEQ